jgi:hypothetical protein
MARMCPMGRFIFSHHANTTGLGGVGEGLPASPGSFLHAVTHRGAGPLCSEGFRTPGFSRFFTVSFTDSGDVEKQGRSVCIYIYIYR